MARIILLLCLIVFFIPEAFSQEERKGFFKLGPNDLVTDTSLVDDEIFSASRTMKKVEDVPVSVHIVSRKEILENGYVTLVDVLKTVPGIRVSQPGSAIEGETFLMRGLHGNYYCKILIDGVPVQPSVVRGMPVSAQLPIRQAERIEITFGPSSSIYGADAMAGVINIVTLKSDRPVTAQADIAFGNLGQEYINVSIGGKAGKNKNVFTYSLFGNYFSRRDMKIKDDMAGVYDPSLYDSSYSYLSAPHYKGDSTRPELGRLPESSRLLGFNLKWRGLSFQFLTMGRAIHSSIGQRTDVYSYHDPSNFWAEVIRRYTLSYEYSRNKFQSLTTLSWLNYRLEEQSSFGLNYPVGPGGKAYKYAASDDLFLEQQFNFIPLPGLEFTAGASITASGNLPNTNDLYEPFNTDSYGLFSEDPISDTAFGTFGYNPVNYTNSSGFVQVYYKRERLVVILGNRYDYHSKYKGANSFRFALQYFAGRKLSVRGTFSQGYRAPSTYYSLNSLAWKQGDSIYYVTVPNRELKPEKLMAGEVGLRWDIHKKLSLDASIFYHVLQKQFTRSFLFLDPSLYPLAMNEYGLSHAYINDQDSRAELFGLQLELKMLDLVEPVHLSGEFLISVSKGKEILPNGLGKIDSYRQWPGFLGQLNFSLRPVSFLYLSFRNILTTKWTRHYLPLDKAILDEIGYETSTKGYYTLDLLARFSINRNFHAFFQINNVLNSRYAGIDAYGSEADLRYNPQFGRNFRLGLTFSME